MNSKTIDVKITAELIDKILEGKVIHKSEDGYSVYETTKFKIKLSSKSNSDRVVGITRILNIFNKETNQVGNVINGKFAYEVFALKLDIIISQEVLEFMKWKSKQDLKRKGNITSNTQSFFKK